MNGIEIQKNLHAWLVATGARASKEDRERLLEIQNPVKQKRGGLGFGLYASVHAGTEKFLVNINVYSHVAEKSPITLRLTQEAKSFEVLFEGEVIGTGTYFAPPEWITFSTSSGKPYGALFQQHTPNSLVGIIGSTRCPLFDSGSQCSFCGMEGGDENSERTMDDMIEALYGILMVKQSYRLTLTTTLFSRDQFPEIVLGIKRLRTAFPKLPIALETQPLSVDQILMLKIAGVDTLMLPLDCADDIKQLVHLPGKKRLLQEVFWQNIDYAVEIFGIGNITSNVIVGLDDLDTSLETVQRLLNIGVIPEPLPVRNFEESNDLPITDPMHLALVKRTILEHAEKISFYDKMADVKSGCPACGGCGGIVLGKTKLHNEMTALSN